MAAVRVVQKFFPVGRFLKIVEALVVGAVQTVQNFVMRFVIWDIYPKLLRFITMI